MKRRATLLTFVFLMSLSSVALAQSDDGGRRGRRDGPPPEAFAACADLAEGDACTVETPRGTREGVCSLTRRSDQLVCRPNDRPERRRKRQGPPPEAFAACADLAEGDACTIETPRGTREGVCDLSCGSGELVCRPNDRSDRRGERQGPPPEAFAACADLAEGDACTVETPGGSREGVCSVSRRSDELVCRPNDRSRRRERAE